MESVTEKFLRYVKVDTQSDELSETCLLYTSDAADD